MKAPAIAIALLGVTIGATAAAAPRVWIADDGARVRRGDTASPLASGEGNAIWRPGSPVRLAALRDEVVAFQVIVEAGDAPLGAVTVDLAALTPPSDHPELAAPTVERFLEHYVTVAGRSHNTRRPEESLGWSPRARPADDRVLGAVPDALIPVDLAAAWCPYPMRIAPRENGAIWIDVTVPAGATPGLWRGTLVVAEPRGGDLARVPIELDVATATLPYRAVSFLAYYGRDEIEERIGDADRAERGLLQLLHRHHVDAFASLRTPDDAARLAPLLDGTLFTPAWGYAGPGAGRAPAAVALGAYGHFGEPTREALGRVEALVPAIPLAVEDVVLYAADEDCESTAGPGWRRLARGSRALGRVRVAHSCPADPRGQDVDLVLVAANAFRTEPSLEARASGKGVWVYNGALPRAGSMLLDADLTSLRASAWIAASHDVERWFLWETTFWNDDNRGGRGAIDPFATAESFHNQHGDTALGDGLLVYPGTQRGRFAAHSLGHAGVLPSMRLKNLRRGIQDAGYLALARSAHPAEADAVVDRLIPSALDEIRDTAASTFPGDGAPFAEAREALRALISDGAALDAAAVRSALEDAAAARRDRVTAARRARVLRYSALVSALIVLAVIATALRRRRSHRPQPSLSLR